MTRTSAKYYLILLIGLCFFSLLACETLEKRIEKNLAYFMSLSPEIQKKIRDKQIDLGFDPKMVYLAWGKKGDSASVTDKNGRFETWIYISSTSETKYRTVSYYDDHLKRWDTRQESYSVWYDYASKFVVFENDKVVRFGTYPRNTLYRGPQDQFDPYNHPYSQYRTCAQMGFSQALLCSYMGGYW